MPSFGAATWEPRALPTRGAVADQEAWLFDAITHLRNVANAHVAELIDGRRTRKNPSDERSER